MVRAFHAALEKSCPKVACGGRQYKDHWYYDTEVKELYARVNTARKLFRRSRTPDNLELLQAAVRTTDRRLKEIRQEKWLEWCASLNAHTSLSQLWDHIRRATGKGKRRAPPHPAPQQEAERLVTLFRDRAESAQLPEPTRRIQQDRHERRSNLVEEACQTASAHDAAFTYDELLVVQKTSRQTAPGEDQISYTMIHKSGEGTKRALLALINASWQQGQLPDSWKRAIGALRHVKTQRALRRLEDACMELGLKINPNKTKAINFRGKQTPNIQLRIQDTAIEWVASHQCLGVHFAHRLTFTPQVTYLRERMATRLNAMRKLTGLSAGADFSVLRTYYVHAIRSLVDYSAVALVGFDSRRIQALQTQQNKALRLMVGAPIWAKIANLQVETNVAPVEVAAALTASNLGFAANLGEDVPNANYDPPPPWTATRTTYSCRLPNAPRDDATRRRIHGELQIARFAYEGSAVYYTDGSADPDTGRCGAAFGPGAAAGSRVLPADTFFNSPGIHRDASECTSTACALDIIATGGSQEVFRLNDRAPTATYNKRNRSSTGFYSATGLQNYAR
ncbi:hypothetical protein O3P69_019047 [Scylla paramamosain]|uniref:Reverse transcriptase n=1 Tax=Scylla paramamosain TaxID=85552 RepID=A0AAW0T801_SCYPA